MPTIITKEGERKEVNAFVAGNVQLMKKYGYTLADPTPEEKKSLTKQEKSLPDQKQAAADKPKEAVTESK
jgi:hypothetical protein